MLWARFYFDSLFDSDFLRNPDLFAHDGWRFELGDDENAELRISGVVYNEMRSHGSSFFEKVLNHLLYKGTEMEFEAGGDLDDLVDLTWEATLEFYHTFYHPSNSLIFYFGNTDGVEELFSLIDEQLNFGQRQMAPYRSLFDTHRGLMTAQPYDRSNASIIFSSIDTISDAAIRQNEVWNVYYLGDRREMSICDIMGLTLLSKLLTDRTSVFYQRLRRSDIGNAPVAHGFGFTLRIAHFDLGMLNVPSCDLPTTETDRDPCGYRERFDILIKEALEETMKLGFDPRLVEALMHNMEFNARDGMPSRSVVGNYFSNAIAVDWAAGLPLFQSFQPEKDIQSLKKELSDNPKYLETLIQK